MGWEIPESFLTGRHQDWTWRVNPQSIEQGMRLFLRDSSDALITWGSFTCGPGNDLGWSESYLRDTDLVCRYPANDTRPFTCELRHRWVPTDRDLTLEHWLSVQTHLLDAHPELWFCTEWPTEDCQFWRRRISEGNACPEVSSSELPSERSNGSIPPWLAATASQSRGTHSLHWLIMLHPLDQHDVHWQQIGDTRWNLRLRFFGGFMEKGVIRRARMRFVASLEPWNGERRTSAWDAFVHSPLPLTA